MVHTWILMKWCKEKEKYLKFRKTIQYKKNFVSKILLHVKCYKVMPQSILLHLICCELLWHDAKTCISLVSKSKMFHMWRTILYRKDCKNSSSNMGSGDAKIPIEKADSYVNYVKKMIILSNFLVMMKRKGCLM